MFAIYATHAAPDDPLSALEIGEQLEPAVHDGWVRVKISHASLNRHDLFTLRGITAHPEGITFPMILGNDGVGTLDDGTPVALYPVMGSDDWRDDETLDPGWHIFSEFVPGTFADYTAVPKRNAIPLPGGLSALHASVLGTAWLTAYRALFTKSGLQPGQRLLVQGSSGGMATALIQLGRAAGFEVWTTSRNDEAARAGRKARRSSHLHIEREAPAQSTGGSRQCRSRIMGAFNGFNRSWRNHRGRGRHHGAGAELAVAALDREQITVRGSIMGTLLDLKDMVSFIAASGITPEIGLVLPMEQAAEGFRAMWEGRTHGKTVFTR